MRRLTFAAIALFGLQGCRAPDRITAFRSGDPNVTYVVETVFGHGPVSSTSSNVYAVLTVQGATDRALVLHGLYLEVKQIDFPSAHEARLCIPKGLASEFHENITLSAGGKSVTMDNEMPNLC